MATAMEQLKDLLGGGEWMWTNASFIAADVEVDRSAAARWLPGGLRPSKPARATLFIADYPETSFGVVYREAAIVLHARFGLLNVRFCPWMLVDDDVALVLGRELLGYPKKLGEMGFEMDASNLRAHVTRKGCRLFDVTAKLGSLEADPPALIAHRTINAFGAFGLTPQSLLMFHPREEIIEARGAEVSWTVNGSDADPLRELGIGPVVSAHWYLLNMGGGRIPPVPVRPIGPGFALRNWKLRFG